MKKLKDFGRMAWIRRRYRVPAYRGARVMYTDDDGVKWYCTIMSARDGMLRVLVDDLKPGYRDRKILHPTFNIKYL